LAPEKELHLATIVATGGGRIWLPFLFFCFRFCFRFCCSNSCRFQATTAAAPPPASSTSSLKLTPPPPPLPPRLLLIPLRMLPTTLPRRSNPQPTRCETPLPLLLTLR
jgi:hypothetical protein